MPHVYIDLLHVLFTVCKMSLFCFCAELQEVLAEVITRLSAVVSHITVQTFKEDWSVPSTSVTRTLPATTTTSVTTQSHVVDFNRQSSGPSASFPPAMQAGPTASFPPIRPSNIPSYGGASFPPPLLPSTGPSASQSSYQHGALPQAYVQTPPT